MLAASRGPSTKTSPVDQAFTPRLPVFFASTDRSQPFLRKNQYFQSVTKASVRHSDSVPSPPRLPSGYPTGLSSAITLPSFGNDPGATSFTAPLSFETD